MPEPAPWIVAGRYEVGEIVGRGGYGMVRRAIDRKTGQPVAMKVLSADAGRDPHLVERMLREQQAMVALAGTCAVTAIDLCRLQSGAPCLVMEWLEGRDLERQMSDWESAGETPSVPDLLQLLQPLTETLQRAHELGIVHRDLKPANIFLIDGVKLSEKGAVRLLDFGLSRMRTAAPLTAVGMVMGSPSYIPPETWRGNSALIDHRADLYSLAVIVFRGLAGRLPFETPSLIQKLELVTTAERPSVCALRPDLPGTVDDWMRRALAIEPDQRFQSAHEFYDALVLALSGSPFTLADDEVSGVRELPLPLPDAHESKNVLALAWERATSLLHRFIGQKAPEPAKPKTERSAPEHEQPKESSPAATAGRPLEATRDSDATLNAAEAELDAVLGAGDRPSVAWLDDSDVEDLPPESAHAAPVPELETATTSDATAPIDAAPALEPTSGTSAPSAPESAPPPKKKRRAAAKPKPKTPKKAAPKKAPKPKKEPKTAKKAASKKAKPKAKKKR